MHFHSVNYKAREKAEGGGSRGNLFNRGFFAGGLPRLLARCTLLGHYPVVDGYGPYQGRPGLHAARWVECRRCGVRPNPQGNLDPQLWAVNDVYLGEFGPGLPEHPSEHAKTITRLKTAGHYPPGAWPAWRTVRGKCGAQVVVGNRGGTLGAGVKVGNKGSEHTLAAHLGLGWLGVIHVWAEQYGNGLVRLLNRNGKHSKEIEWSVMRGRLYWKLWADRDAGWSNTARGWAKWHNHSVKINPVEVLLGPNRYGYDETGDHAGVLVRMPDDNYPVEMKLQRRFYGRSKLPRKQRGWTVEWECRGGIPTKPPANGRNLGGGVDVSDESVRAGTWPDEAVALIALNLQHARTRCGWEPSGTKITV